MKYWTAVLALVLAMTLAPDHIGAHGSGSNHHTPGKTICSPNDGSIYHGDNEIDAILAYTLAEAMRSSGLTPCIYVEGPSQYTGDYWYEGMDYGTPYFIGSYKYTPTEWRPAEHRIDMNGATRWETASMVGRLIASEDFKSTRAIHQPPPDDLPEVDTTEPDTTEPDTTEPDAEEPDSDHAHHLHFHERNEWMCAHAGTQPGYNVHWFRVTDGKVYELRSADHTHQEPGYRPDLEPGECP